MALPPPMDEDLPDRVLVYTRIRPPISPHIHDEDIATRCRGAADGKTRSVLVSNPGAAVPSKSFTMDRVLGPKCTQKEVYDAVGAPILDSVLRGCHGCVLAYGQTGSGKTHSMLNLGEDGHADEAGMMPRLAVDLFTRIAADWTNFYEVEIAMVQIYNETAMDLLSRSSGDDKQRSSPPNHQALLDRGLKASQRKASEGGGWELLECAWYRCKSPEYLLECFRNGRKRLVYAETMMNKHSSRSHCVLQLRVNRVPRVGTAAVASAGGKKVELVQQRGLLTVVDMAGSERVKKTMSEGVRFNEATNINTSLLAFGNVVQALAAKRSHVPYRESMLTKLLESSLSGRSRTALLVCVAPEVEHAQESTTALEFASRCMRVETKPDVRSASVQFDPSTLARELAEGSAMTVMERMGQQVVSSQQLLDREKVQRAETEEHLCDVINRERKERANVEESLHRRVGELEAELESVNAELDEVKRNAHKSSAELSRANARAAAAEERYDAQTSRCNELEAALAAERLATERAAQCAAETAEEELRELLRRNKEDHAAIEARLRVEIEREKKARVEAEDFLRQESERERTERAATENLLRESLAQEKNERAKMEEELREALNRERSERGDIETDLREKLRREIKGRVETEEKLHLRVSELEAEIASANMRLSDVKRDALDTDRRLSCALGDVAEAEGRCTMQSEKAAALQRELEAEREAAQYAAHTAAEAAEERLKNTVEGEKARHECAREELRRELLADNDRAIEKVRADATAAEERILHRVRELEAEVQRHAEDAEEARKFADERDTVCATLQGELSRLRAGWREDLTELQRASAATASEAESMTRAQLASGISLAKRGRNGKIYRRMVRCHLDSNTLEWAPLGQFRTMSIKGAQMVWASDGSGFVLRGPKRDFEVSVTDASAASWGRALHRRLPVTGKQLTPLRVVLGKPITPLNGFGGLVSFGSLNSPNSYCPSSPATAAAVAADMAAKKHLALGEPRVSTSATTAT